MAGVYSGWGGALTLTRLKKAGMEHLGRMVVTVLDDTGYRVRTAAFARHILKLATMLGWVPNVSNSLHEGGRKLK